MWVFGYGSLIWKQGFRYLEDEPGFIRGWKRRFYQGSPDHRGTPGALGRVVTLLPEPEAICWGVAFRLDQRESERVLAELDHRESGGYERHFEPVYRCDTGGEPVYLADALVYVATVDNAHYLGPATEAEIARQVLVSHGPSGPNTEYVLELAEALRARGLDDPHVFAIERELQKLLAARKPSHRQ